MVSITPRIFYGFSPTTSSPHITTINSATSLRLLYYVSRVRQLLCGSLQIQYSARDGICTRRNIYTSLHVLLEAIYLLKPPRDGCGLRYILLVPAGCCLRSIYSSSCGCCLRYNLDFILKSVFWIKPTSLLLQNMLYKP